MAKDPQANLFEGKNDIETRKKTGDIKQNQRISKNQNLTVVIFCGFFFSITLHTFNNYRIKV